MAEITATDNGLRTTDDTICRFLRSKEMYIHMAEPDWHLAQSHSGIFWCAHTQKCLGPDGQTAEPKTCLAGRACYRTV